MQNYTTVNNYKKIHMSSFLLKFFNTSDADCSRISDTKPTTSKTDAQAYFIKPLIPSKTSSVYQPKTEMHIRVSYIQSIPFL